MSTERNRRLTRLMAIFVRLSKLNANIAHGLVIFQLWTFLSTAVVSFQKVGAGYVFAFDISSGQFVELMFEIKGRE